MRIIYFFLFLLFFSHTALAQGFVIDPYLGYETGDVEQGRNSDDASGENLGFRVGGLKSRFMFGFEYALSTLDVDSPGGDDELKTKDLGFFLGYTYQSIRIWATYWFNSEADSENMNGTYDGQGGYKIGLGIAALGSMHINIEKTLRNYGEFEGEKLTHAVEVDGVLISVSLPITF